jgi:transcription antitermination factor NusG
MRSGHIANWLEVKDQVGFLKELSDIQIAAQSDGGAELYPQLRRGQWVRVVSGALRGVRGRISRRKEKYRIVLDLTALHAAVAVEVDMGDVEPATVDEEDWLETREDNPAEIDESTART